MEEGLRLLMSLTIVLVRVRNLSSIHMEYMNNRIIHRVRLSFYAEDHQTHLH